MYRYGKSMGMITYIEIRLEVRRRSRTPDTMCSNSSSHDHVDGLGGSDHNCMNNSDYYEETSQFNTNISNHSLDIEEGTGSDERRE